MVSRLLSTSPYEARVMGSDLVSVLEDIRSSIPGILTAGELRRVLQQLNTFGLHSARLDIREDSARIDATLGEILRALEIELAYTSLAHDKQVELLLRLLKQPVPPLAPHPGVTQDTSETWALFPVALPHAIRCIEFIDDHREIPHQP